MGSITKIDPRHFMPVSTDENVTVSNLGVLKKTSIFEHLSEKVGATTLSKMQG